VRGLHEGLEGLRVVNRGGIDVVLARRNGRDVELRELSDGYQAILVIVLDLTLRFAFLKPVVDDPRRRAALVVVDEVDLHLHPRWQRRVVRQLANLFPEVQWVLTTHSPAVVQGAIDDGHLVVRMREEDGATRVDTLTEAERKKLRGAQLGSVVVDRHLFGAPSRFSPKFEALERKTHRLGRKMEAGRMTEEDRKELIRTLDRLARLMTSEEKRWLGAPIHKGLMKSYVVALKLLAKKNEEAARGAP
jgi:hypothetical protein